MRVHTSQSGSVAAELKWDQRSVTSDKRSSYMLNRGIVSFHELLVFRRAYRT